MPRNVIKISKSGESEQYEIKDVGARSLISAETLARETAVENAENAVAAQFDTSRGYYPGEYAFYEDDLYCRKSIGSAEGQWYSGRWNAAELAADVHTLRTQVQEDARNILFSAKYINHGHYYNTSTQEDDTYFYIVVPVSANVTYYANKNMRFISTRTTNLAQNVTSYTPSADADLFITFLYDEKDPFYYLTAGSDFSAIMPYVIYRNGTLSDFQRNIDERNLLNQASFLRRGYYYNGTQQGEHADNSYSYLIIPVVSGQSYYIHSARMLSKKSTVITTTAVFDYEYIPDFTGNLYITVYNRYPWIVSTKADMSDVAPYNYPSFTETSLMQTTGSDTRRPMSQKAVTDAITAASKEGSIYAALLEVLADKKIAQFGDSIMAGDGASNRGPGEALAIKYGMTVYEYAVGGATMGYHSGSQHIIDKVDAAISAGIEPDIILINGGTNDMHGTTPNCALGTVSSTYTLPAAADEFSNGFESVAYKIKSTWPEAMVIYVRAHNMSSRLYDRQISYGERGIEIADKWGFGVIDMYKRMNSQLSYYEIYVPDGTHPNADGYERYYIPAIEQYLYERRNEFIDEEEP